MVTLSHISHRTIDPTPEAPQMIPTLVPKQLWAFLEPQGFLGNIQVDVENVAYSKLDEVRKLEPEPEPGSSKPSRVI